MERSAKRRRICDYYGTTTGPSCSRGMVTSSGYDYEVFLSFRGPDTRSAFTDFLYTSLDSAGIRTFKDDEELRVGEEFAPELLQAIMQSKISIPIFSKGYASSVWCLKELAQMVECQKTGRQKIMPIFYDVAPSEVRYQTGGYGEALRSHEEKQRYDKETLREWKAALKEVSFLNGWELHNMSNRREGEFARKLTQKVFGDLKKAYLVVSDYLVSVDNHADAIMKMIGAGTSETRIIGIHGMGGIGKTTIAKLIYNKLSDNFENCCFLCNIRETSKINGIQCLQNQLISDILKGNCVDSKDADGGTQTIKDRLSNKRVLLLLDDVEEENHIDALVGKRDWLGKGSKIIITTRNKDMLEVPEVDYSYELSCMDRNQSLQLFSKHAFRRDYPLDEYIDQSKRVIAIAGGLPLTLEVMGSLLCRTKKKNWDLTLKKLENVPHVTVQSKLRISYDALDIRQQHIFLDVACLFIGYDKDIMVHFWDESKYPEDAMEVLQNMSLIKIKKDNEVWMHDQLRDLGREIVRQKSEMKIEKQIRVWDPKEGLDLLGKHKGNKEVEALRLKLDHRLQFPLTYECFESLSNLRFLEVDSWIVDFPAEERLFWHESPSNVLPATIFEENSNLLPQLRWLSWHCIPPTLKITHFSLEDMVFLDLSSSKITHNWKGWSHIKAMKNLKVLNLSYCYCLERTPNFSAHTNLERLILIGCSTLVEIDGSICQLKRLAFLTVQGCEELQRLPDEVGNLESLIELDIANTKIKELPDSIGNLKNLKILEMRLTMMRKTLSVLLTMEKLEEIEVSNYYGDPGNIDNCIYRNQSLKILKLERFKIYAVPKLPESLVSLCLHSLYMDSFPDLSNLTNLKELDMRFQFRDSDGEYRESDGPLEEYPIPRWMGNLSNLESLHLTSPHVITSPIDLTLPPHLKSLYIDCPNLHRLPRLPSILSCLHLEQCYSLRSMQSLHLYSPYVTTSPIDLTLPPHLKELRLYYCPKLRRLPRLPSSLSSLGLYNCQSLCSMEGLSNLKNLSSLEICCAAIAEIQGFGCLGNLQDLKLDCLEQVKILPDLSNLNKLRILQVHGCGNLVEIQGALPRFLGELHISFCDSLQNLPDLSSLMGKQWVEIRYCSKLNVEAILGFARINPRYLQLLGFGQLQILPNLSNSSELRCLDVRDCHNLIEIQGELPESLEGLKISSCDSLQNLPDLSSLMGKQEVEIKNCSKLNMETILGFARINPRDLRLLGFGQLRTLPDLSSSSEIRCLQVHDCHNLIEIQGKVPESLEELEINSCESLMKLPDLSNLKNLSSLYILSAVIEEIQGLGCLENLRDLKLFSLEEVKILPDLSNLNKLMSLRVHDCHNLIEIQGELQESLIALEISSCDSLQKLPDLSSLKGLQMVTIKHCKELKGDAIFNFARRRQANLWENLQYLQICGLEQMEILSDLSDLNKLRSLLVSECANLVEIQGELPRFLDELHISSCDSLQILPDLSCLMGKQQVEIKYCSKLNVEAILGFARINPRDLRLWGFGQLQILPDLSSSSELRSLEVCDCPNLVEIQGELPQSLEELEIDSCESLQKLPDLSRLMRQGKVHIIGCWKLNSGEDDEFESESDGEYEFESESEGEDHESEYEV